MSKILADKKQLTFLKYELYYRWKFLEEFNTWYSSASIKERANCYEKGIEIFDELLKLYKKHLVTNGFIIESADISVNKKRRIYAAVQVRCSNKNLAEYVGLEENEINSWLQEYYNKGNVVTKNTPFKDIDIKQGQCYTVPNTFVTALGFGIIGYIPLDRWQYKVINAFEKRGFLVEVYRDELGTNKNEVINASNSSDTWGYMYLGHGFQQKIAWYWPLEDKNFSHLKGAFSWSETYDVIESKDFRKKFKFGLGINYHCYADSHPWNSYSIVYFGGIGSLSALSGPRGIGWWGSWDSLVGEYTHDINE